MLYVLTPSSLSDLSVLARRAAGHKLVVSKKLLDQRLTSATLKEKKAVGELVEAGHVIEVHPEGTVTVNESDALAERLRPIRDAQLEGSRRDRERVEENYETALGDILSYTRTLRGVDGDPPAGAVIGGFFLFGTQDYHLPSQFEGTAVEYFREVGIEVLTPPDLNSWEAVEPQFAQLGGGPPADLRLVLLSVVGWLVGIPLAVGLILFFARSYIAAATTWAFEWVVGNVSAVVGGFILAALGVGLYWVRGHARFWYGLLEYAVGVAVTMVAWPAPEHAADLDPWLKVAAGLYVMVRALDNIGKGIRKDTRRARWFRRFGSENK